MNRDEMREDAAKAPIEAWRRALALDAERGPTRDSVRLRLRLAMSLVGQRKLADAVPEFTKVLADLDRVTATAPAADDAERRDDAEIRCDALAGRANLLTAAGQRDAALALLRDHAATAAAGSGDDLRIAWVAGRIADLHEAAGRADEAMRVRREEELPAAARTNQPAVVAVVWNKIADGVQSKGAWDEAILVRRDHVLPHVPAEDTRGRAGVLMKIADAHASAERWDEAVRVRREEALPLYTAAGDVPGAAILHASLAADASRRGDTDHALSILRNEVIAPLEAAGSWAALVDTLLLKASVLQKRGGTDDKTDVQATLRRAYDLAVTHDLPIAKRFRKPPTGPGGTQTGYVE